MNSYRQQEIHTGYLFLIFHKKGETILGETSISPKAAEIIISVIVSLISVAASSGFWIYVGQKSERKTLQTDLLIGLAHDRIMWLGLNYIERGWISQDEYENLNVYLYQPYEKLGGNGSARRIMVEVDKLPIRKLQTSIKGD